MLAALEKFDELRSRAVLARATESLLEPRFIQGAEVQLNEAEDAAVRDVLAEIASKAQKTKGLTEDERRSAMLDMLSRAITLLVLSKRDEADVRTRLGFEGRLPISAYQVAFSPQFEGSKKLWGLSQSQVMHAILHSDYAQHLRTELEGAEGEPVGSLFTQNQANKGDPFTILVKSNRLGDRLFIDGAFRIYHSEIEVNNASPLELFRRFIEKFGSTIEIKLEGSDKSPEFGNFFHGVIYKITQGTTLTIKYSSGEIVHFPYRPEDPRNMTELSVCYSLDNVAYAEMLARHGVKVQLPKRPASSHMFRSIRDLGLKRK